MSKEHQLPSDSDEDDEDYVPDGADNEAVSEAESEGEVESGPEDENDENKRDVNKKRSNKKSKNNTKRKGKVKKILKNESKSEEDEDDNEDEDTEEAHEKAKEKNRLTEEEEKKRADSLWADFMKDTGVTSKAKPQNTTNSPREKSPPVQKVKTDKTVKITQIFEFAGEEVKVEKEVSVDSAEARLTLSSGEHPEKVDSFSSTAAKGTGRGRGAKRTGLGGISSVLGQIGKKSKISTLEKSKLDWDNYKKEENLEEEITTHNKGKDGYLERQDFLQRADLRQFEIEKRLRNTNRRSSR